MAIRIAGVTLPDQKNVTIALTYIYGIGLYKSRKILTELKIDTEKRVRELTETESNAIRTRIEKKERVEGDLKREIFANIKRLKEIKSYRGLRHTKGLPVRGQRTKTNSRSVRGNVRRTMGSGRRGAAQKT